MKEKITKWYKMGLWTKEMVKNAAVKGILTDEEVTEIIGVEKVPESDVTETETVTNKVAEEIEAGPVDNTEV